MSLLNVIQNLYTGNITLFEGAERNYRLIKGVCSNENHLDLVEELERSSPCPTELSITLGDTVDFTEITHFQKNSFCNMSEGIRNEKIDFIVNNFKKFGIEPVGHDVRDCSIIIFGYLLLKMNPSAFEDDELPMCSSLNIE
ncbi:hypothetical protein ACWFRC_07510 [Bacillus cereus]